MNSEAAIALNQYKNAGNSSIAYADPHQLILRLFDGAIDRIAQARGAMQQQDTAAKGQLIGKAIGIVNGLNACLDHQQGGELSANLASLYEYMGVRLLQANVENDQSKLDEVSQLLQEIRSAWVEIGPS